MKINVKQTMKAIEKFTNWKSRWIKLKSNSSKAFSAVSNNCLKRLKLFADIYWALIADYPWRFKAEKGKISETDFGSHFPFIVEFPILKKCFLQNKNSLVKHFEGTNAQKKSFREEVTFSIIINVVIIWLLNLLIHLRSVNLILIRLFFIVNIYWLITFYRIWHKFCLKICVAIFSHWINLLPFIFIKFVCIAYMNSTVLINETFVI